MIAFFNTTEVQDILRNHVKERSLSMCLTQAGLAERSGVPIATLRKFERTGLISLESFLKLVMVVGDPQALINAVKPEAPSFDSIEEVIASNRNKTVKKPKRCNRR